MTDDDRQTTACRQSANPRSKIQNPKSARTRVGWQGIAFTLPPDWNVTALSMNPSDGYLKVDSPERMFAQVRWIDPAAGAPRTLLGLLLHYARKRRAPVHATDPDLTGLLEGFLKNSRDEARKMRVPFSSKVRPRGDEADGERTAYGFSWSGGGVGQGKVWHCRTCGRVVIAQVVGAPKDPVAAAASEMFSRFTCHPQDGWAEWALYDLVAHVPEDFRLVEQAVRTGHLRLAFRRGADRIVIERWGLANVVRKRFTLAEWFEQACPLDRRGLETEKDSPFGHTGCRARGKVRGILRLLRALRDAGPRRPATLYEGCAWECEETNRLFTIQTWRGSRSAPLLEQLEERCRCH